MPKTREDRIFKSGSETSRKLQVYMAGKETANSSFQAAIWRRNYLDESMQGRSLEIRQGDAAAGSVSLLFTLTVSGREEDKFGTGRDKFSKRAAAGHQAENVMRH